MNATSGGSAQAHGFSLFLQPFALRWSCCIHPWTGSSHLFLTNMVTVRPPWSSCSPCACVACFLCPVVLRNQRASYPERTISHFSQFCRPSSVCRNRNNLLALHLQSATVTVSGVNEHAYACLCVKFSFI